MARTEFKASESQIDEWKKVLADYQYDGFDPKQFRVKLKEDGFTKSDIQIALALYCQIGNNPLKAKKDRKSSNASAEAVLRKIKGDVTLSRIAVSYPKEVRAIRKFGLDNKLLKPRFAIDVPADLQDPALACMMDERQYILFSTAFSKAIGDGQVKMEFYHLALLSAMDKEADL